MGEDVGANVGLWVGFIVGAGVCTTTGVGTTGEGVGACVGQEIRIVEGT